MFDTLKNISRYIGTIFNDNCAETCNCLKGKETKDLDRDTMHTIWLISGIFPGGGGGGGHSGTEGGRTCINISRKKGSLLRPPHVSDFVKVGCFQKIKNNTFPVFLILYSFNHFTFFSN